MRQFLGQGQRFLTPLQSLVWITKVPKSPGRVGEAHDYRILHAGKGTTLLRAVEGYSLLQVLSGRGQFSEKEQGHSQCIVSPQPARWIAQALSEAQALLCQLTRRL